MPERFEIYIVYKYSSFPFLKENLVTTGQVFLQITGIFLLLNKYCQSTQQQTNLIYAKTMRITCFSIS